MTKRKIFNAKRCSRCILPFSYSGIQFDQIGECNICKGWDKRWKDYDFAKKGVEFKQLFSPRTGQYDCILPYSGGKDSSYVLYFLVKRLGLKPLAINLNNHFQTEIIRENITNVVNHLGVDLITFSPNIHVWSELMRRSFEHSMIPCLPCDVGIYALAYRMALMTGTERIVFPGGKLASPKNPGRGVIMFKSLEMVSKEKDQERGTVDLSDFRITQDMVDSVKEIYFGQYFDWKEDLILKTVVTELGWKKKGEQHSRIDCIFEPIINYLYSVRMGVSKQCTRLSSMIRDGQITREEALSKDDKYKLANIPNEFEQIKKILKVNNRHLERQVINKDLLKPLWYQ